MSNIQETIKSILVNDLFVEVPEHEIGVDDGLRNIFGLDSLGFVELRVQCEDRFGITISDEDFDPENFATIRQLAHLVENLQATRAESA